MDNNNMLADITLALTTVIHFIPSYLLNFRDFITDSVLGSVDQATPNPPPSHSTQVIHNVC